MPRELVFTDPDGTQRASRRSVRRQAPGAARARLLPLPACCAAWCCDGVVERARAAMRLAPRPRRPRRSRSASIPSDTPATRARKQSRPADRARRAIRAPADAWPFLVGRRPRDRARSPMRSGFATPTIRAPAQYAHPAVVFVLTPDGRISRYLYGTDFRPRSPARAARGGGGEHRQRRRSRPAALLSLRPGARRTASTCVGVMRGGSAAVLLLFALAGLTGAACATIARAAVPAEEPVNELLRRLLFLPPQASSIAREIDTLHYFVILATIAGAALVALVGAYLRDPLSRAATAPRRCNAARRRRARGLARGAADRRAARAVLALVGDRLRAVRAHARRAGRTRWTSTSPPSSGCGSSRYPDGQHVGRNVLYVPVGRPVKLIMTSRDVIHSFYVPDFRIKQDVVPGRYTTDWFEATDAGHLPDPAAPSTAARGHSLMRGAGRRARARRLRALARRPRVRAAGSRLGRRAAGEGRALTPREPRRRARSARRRRARLPALPLARRHAAHRPDLGRRSTARSVPLADGRHGASPTRPT